MNTILILGFVLAFLLGVLASTRKNKEISHNILSILFFTVGFHLLVHYVFLNFDLVKWLYFLKPVFPLVFGPLVYFYILSLTQHKFTFKKTYLWHIMPFVIGYLVRLIIGGFLTEPSLIETHSLYQQMKLLGVISIAVYPLFGLFEILSYKKRIMQRFSNIELYTLGWLKKILILFSLTWLLVFVGISVNRVFEIISFREENVIIYISLIGFVIALGYFGIKQTNIFSDLKMEFDQEDFKTEPNEKHAELYSSIKNMMIHEKIFLETELSLDKLAQRMGSNTLYVSKAINFHANKNFFEFVNEYRVDELKEKLKDESNVKESILQLALESGFNSKATCNRLFKQLTGKTPTQFRKDSFSGLDS